MRVTVGVLAGLAVMWSTGCKDVVEPPVELSAGEAAPAASESAMQISNLSVQSGKTYKVIAGGVTSGARYYIDRGSVLLSPIPAAVQGLTLIKTAKADRSAAPGSSSFLSFDVDRDVTVYVAHDNGVVDPKWLGSGFEDTGGDLLATDGKGTRSYSVYYRRFSKGRVVLGSNVTSGFGGGMYVVAVAASDGGSGSPPPPPAPPPPGTAVNCTFYVGPNGTAANPGTAAAPWSLAYLLWDNAGGKARSGHTVCVRGGTYSTGLVGEVGENGRTSLAGSAGAPLIIRAFPGERVTLDGGLTINGADTWWWGFDFTYSGWTTRSSPEAGSWPKAIRGPLTGLTVHGARVKVINSTVHDMGGGIESWESAVDAELYGNLIYYIGWTGPDRGHGHATYVQSNTGTRKIRDNLSWDSFANGNVVYGSDAVQLRNVELIGNGAWNHGSLGPEGYNQFLLGAGGSTENITFTDNVVYDGYGGASTVRFGYDPNAVNRNYAIRNNYLIGGEPALRIWNLTQSSFIGNTTYSASDGGVSRMDMLKNTAGYAWSGNTHFGSQTAKDWGYNNIGYTWAAWRSATGLGNGDTYIEGQPSGVKVFVRPNQYEPGRANVIVFSHSGATTATLDLSAIGLKPGQPYEVRNAQNFFGPPVTTGTGPGGVTVPLAGLSKAPVKGSAVKQPSSTGTRFNAFVVVPK